MTLQALVNACPAPVSSAEGVSNAMKWFEIVSVFAIEHSNDPTDTDYMPNAMYVRNLCEVNARNTILMSTDYNSINNNLMHVKVACDAVLQNQQ